MTVLVPAVQALQNQFHEIQTDTTCGFSAGLIQNNIFRWRVTLIGPSKTPYEGGVLPILIDFPCDFPDEPPKMRFLCPMYHPNVRDSGEICIAILRPQAGGDGSDGWYPWYTVGSIMSYLISTMADPNCDSPENVDAARTYITDKMEFVRKARRVVEQANECLGLK
jgi:ubiquitin-conjugating enzyme E2 G1